MKKKPVAKVRLKERRRRESYLMYGLYILALVLVLGGTAYVTRMPQLRVQEVRVEGAVYADPEEIKTLTRDVLASTYALLVPKDMRYVVPKGAVVERLTSALPLLESATVRRDGTQLTVLVTERTPIARYCAATCYRMDAYGFIFDVVHGDESLPDFRGGQLTIGDTYLSGAFHDLKASIQGIEAATQRRVVSVLVDETDDVFAKLEGGGEVRFVRTASPTKLETDVRSIMASSRMAGGASIEYIELRFGTKAAVKLRE